MERWLFIWFGMMEQQYKSYAIRMLSPFLVTVSSSDAGVIPWLFHVVATFTTTSMFECLTLSPRLDLSLSLSLSLLLAHRKFLWRLVAEVVSEYSNNEELSIVVQLGTCR
jgi:hypothetical protein